MITRICLHTKRLSLFLSLVHLILSQTFATHTQLSLMQWAPSLIPAPRTDSSSYNPASPQYAYAGVDSLLSDARGEIADVEKQLSSVQATRLKFAEERAAETRLRIAEQRERAAAKSLPSPSSSSSAPVAEAEASKPNGECLGGVCSEGKRMRGEGYEGMLPCFFSCMRSQ